jgi:hypothetical protein
MGYRRARQERKRKREELTLSTTEKSDLQRDAMWNCGFLRETCDLERKRGGKTIAATERVRDREMVLNFCFIGLGQLEA